MCILITVNLSCIQSLVIIVAAGVSVRHGARPPAATLLMNKKWFSLLSPLAIEDGESVFADENIFQMSSHDNDASTSNSACTCSMVSCLAASFLRWACIVRYALQGIVQHQNGNHFTDDICRCISVNEKFCILIKISLKFVPKRQIDNNPALFQVMAWRRIGDKPLSEPMLTRFTDVYMRH